MRIAQVSPLYEAVPPKMYGGTERVVSYLTEELVRQGHDVTLFASGDSITKARLIPACEQALRLGKCLDTQAYHIIQLQEIADRVNEFDVIHFHTDYLHFAFSKALKKPNLTTLHGRLDLPELPWVYKKFSNMPIVSISRSQMGPLPMANWIGTVYHGLPLDLYDHGEGDGDYVAFIGRISPEKRVDRAIEIAEKAGCKIRIAAKIDKVDQEYFEKEIAHLIELPHVEYLGEIGEDAKGAFLGKAKALLFPVDWPEPFGMAMIESMACGTPVIAWRNGSVPEVIDILKTGFVVNSMEDAVGALENIDLVSRKECRQVFEKRFSAARMAGDYLRLYEEILDNERKLSVAFNAMPVGTKTGT